MEAIFPIKGINRVAPRSAQPEGTTYDCMNVLPFDDYGRLRGGSRGGLGKLYADVLNADQNVSQMIQTRRAIDPDTITASVLQVSNIFTTLGTGNLDTLDTDFTTYEGSQPISEDISSTAANEIAVDADGCYDNSTGGAKYGLYTPTLTLGSAYLVRGEIKLGQTSAATLGAGFAVRISKTGLPTSDSVTVILRTTEVRLYYDGGSSAFAFSPNLTQGGTYLLEVRVNGDTIKVFVDSVEKLSVTVTNPADSQTGVALVCEARGGVAVANTARVRNMDVYTGRNLGSYVQNQIVYTCGENVYIGDTDSVALANDGSGIVSDQTRPQMAYSAGYVYIVDGVSILKLNLTTQDIETYTATAGTAPTKCTLACMWRDRLVLAAPVGNAQNFFCSRIGTHTDWDYSQTDPAAAFAGNASTAGRIGEPLVALIPFSEDILLLMGDKNIWMMRGDPADGGSIDLLSDNIGILGPNAWAKSPDGTVHFVGPGGLYKLVPSQDRAAVINLSERTYPQFFEAINPSQSHVICAWDKDKKGMWVFVSPINTGEATHLWYDARTSSDAEGGAFFPQQFPDAHGPYSALVYDGDGPDDRLLLIGGRDGYVRALNSENLRDDGTKIDSYCFLGPWRFGGERNDAIVTAIDFTLGEVRSGGTATDWNMDWYLYAGNSAYAVTEGTPHGVRSGNMPLAGRQVTRQPRLRGQWFSLKLNNQDDGDYWSMESVKFTITPGGKTRH